MNRGATDRPCLPNTWLRGFNRPLAQKNIQGLQQDFSGVGYRHDGLWPVCPKPEWEYSGKLWQAQLNDFINDVIGRPAGNGRGILWGGYSALCVAANHPDSVAGLVLFE